MSVYEVGINWTLADMRVCRRTVKLLRTVAIKLEDGTPIAWAFLGRCHDKCLLSFLFLLVFPHASLNRVRD